jgi:hypothetical protein
MTIQGLTFSQSSLQDFLDCRRRFQLRYVEGQVWPGVVAEPALVHEQYLERGSRFHRLVQRHQLGIDAALLQRGIVDPELRRWWDRYLSFEALHRAGGRRYPEYALSMAVAGVRLTAVFDLLLVVPGERMVIYDWKTYERTPSRDRLRDRLQTRVYLSVLVSAGAVVFGSEVRPDQVSFVYWVAGTGDVVEFEYASGAYERDTAFVEGVLAEVGACSDSGEWLLTEDVSECRFCVYRSLCGRGDQAFEMNSNDIDNITDRGDLGLVGLDDVGELGF